MPPLIKLNEVSATPTTGSLEWLSFVGAPVGWRLQEQPFRRSIYVCYVLVTAGFAVLGHVDLIAFSLITLQQNCERRTKGGQRDGNSFYFIILRLDGRFNEVTMYLHAAVI